MLLQPLEEWHQSDIIQWHAQPHLGLYVLPLHHDIVHDCNHNTPCSTATYTLKHIFLDT